MEKAKVCVQAMTIKKAFAELGAYEAMKKMADIGYYGIEMSQVSMDEKSVLEMQKACDEFKIEVVAISGNIDGEGSLVTDLGKYTSDCKKLNCSYIRIGMMPVQYMHSEATLKDFCNKAEDIAAKLSVEGIKLYYHNHHVEFQKIGGKFVIDLVREWAPNIGVELDVHWVQRGGANPVDVIKSLSGKIDLLHLKDYSIYSVENAIKDSVDGKIPNEYFGSCVRFAEVGEGNLDMKAIIEAGIASGSKYLIVEQDETYGRDPYESLALSAANIKKLGYADCF